MFSFFSARSDVCIDILSHKLKKEVFAYMISCDPSLCVSIIPPMTTFGKLISAYAEISL